MNTPDEFAWFALLPEAEKISRLKIGIRILQGAADQQLKLLHRYHLSSAHKEIGFAYFYPTVAETWKQINFAVFLGQTDFMELNYFPARMICENVFRLEHYINQKKAEQNAICLWEMLRVAKRFYDEFGASEFAHEYKECVEKFGEAGVVYPDITDKSAYRDPFPNMAQLIAKSKLQRTAGFYKHYQFLCESHHGKLISLHIANHPQAQYRRNLLYVFIFCRWLLIITDSHIRGATTVIVNQAIIEGNKAVFSKPA